MRSSLLILATLAVLLLSSCGAEGPPATADLVAGLDRGTHEERLAAAAGLAALGSEGLAALRARLTQPPGPDASFRVDAPEGLDGRFYAAQALGAFGQDGVPVLLDVLGGADEIARIEAQRVLAGLTLDEDAIDRLGALLAGSNVMAAARAGELLGMQPAEAAARGAARAAADERPFFRRRALLVGAQREDALGQATIEAFLADPDPGLRTEALKLLGTRIVAGHTGNEAVDVLLGRLAKESEADVATWITTVLQQLDGQDAARVAAHLVGVIDGPLAERLPAVLAAWGDYDPAVRAPVEALLERGAPRVQVRAILALGALHDKARSEGRPWLGTEETATVREAWIARLLSIADASGPEERAEALLALASFPEASAATVTRLRAALEGDDGDVAAVAILVSESLVEQARQDLREAVDRWRRREHPGAQRAADLWWERYATGAAAAPAEADGHREQEAGDGR